MPVDLTPEQEEVATFFAVMKETGARRWRGWLAAGWQAASRAAGAGQEAVATSFAVAKQTRACLAAQAARRSGMAAGRARAVAACVGPVCPAAPWCGVCWPPPNNRRCCPSAVHPPTHPWRTDYMGKQTFLDNFWEGFREVLGPGHAIKSLAK